MPIYEYRCKKCGYVFERMQKFSDPHPTDCPDCKAKNSVEQLLSAPAVQFKGSGWYVTDYAKKSHTPASSDSGSKDSKDSKESKESKKDDKKTESSAKESTTKKADKHK